MISFNHSSVSSSYLTTGQAANKLGLSIPTVKSLIADGSLRSYVTKGGHHRLCAKSVHSFLMGEEESDQTQLEQEQRSIAIYVRVSSQSQASDGSLDRQNERLLTEVCEREGIERESILVFKDIASSFGGREGLNKLVDSMLEGKIGKVYCEYQDRLSRIGALTKLVEHLAERSNVEIVCLDVEETDVEDNAYFVKELLDYITVVTNKISAAKSRRVTMKGVGDEVAKRVLKLRGQGYSVSKIAQIAREENLTNDRDEVLSSYMVEKVVFDPQYAIHGLQVQPKQIAKEWLVANITRVEGARLMNRELMAAYEKSCQEKGIHPIAKSDLGLLMVEIFGGRYRTQGTTAYRGVQLVG